MELSIDGSTVTATWDCKSRGDLVGGLGALHFVLPVALTLEFGVTVTVSSTSGTLGNVRFTWQVESTKARFETLEPQARDDRVLVALQRLPMLCRPDNRRLLAAATYLQKATRLLAAGDGPSEFAGEAIVNLAKALEVVFPGAQSRDAVRAGLSQLGLGAEKIEAVFVPALVLRASLDAAHVRMASLTTEEKRQLQMYMENVMPAFRALLVDITDRTAAGAMEMAEYEERDRELGDELARLLQRLGSDNLRA